MKKIRVDFVAHISVVVDVNESEDAYEVAEELAQTYVDCNPSIKAKWQIEDGGINDAGEYDSIDISQNDYYKED